MRKLLALALLTLSPAALAQPPAPPEGQSRTFEASDLFGLEVASDPQISPDGRRIA